MTVAMDSVRAAVTPPLLVRMGGLPIDVIDALQFRATMACIESIIACEEQLRCRKDGLVDALHDAVGSCMQDRAVRGLLLRMKRDVFNMRPLESETLCRVMHALPPRTHALLDDWVQLWEQQRRLSTGSQEIFSREMSQKRVLLKEVVAIEDFRRGIALASPDLDKATDAYLASDHQSLTRSQRVVERSLFEYLLRTACKTSPFSTFTSVGTGRFVPLPAEEKREIIYQSATGDAQKKSFVRLNMAILSKLSAFIVASPQIQAELPLSLTPGWHMDGGQIRYVRRTQSEDERETGAVAPLEVVHENIFYLPVGSLLSAVIDVLGKRSCLRLHELAAQICTLFPFQDAEIDAYLKHLIRLGLLIVPDLHVDLHQKYPLTSYRRALVDMHIPLLGEIADNLEQIETRIKAYEYTTASGRRGLRVEIERLVRACYAVLGQEQTPLPQTILYEDMVCGNQKLVLNETAWQPLLDSVAEFQRIVPLFDFNLPKRLVTRGYFQARYGAGGHCDDFLHFAYDFQQRFFIHYLKNERGVRSGNKHPNFFQQQEIAQINSAQQVLNDAMQQALKELPASQDELVLADDFLATLLPYVPQSGEPFHSQSYFSQYMRVDDEARLVINHIYTGCTLMFSRFAHFFDADEGQDFVAEIRAHLERLQPRGAVFVELKGGYDATNLNLHPAVTAYELVCPGDVSARPEDEQILLEDLRIQDDVEQGRLCLYSRRLGKEVIPLYLGFLLPMALPEIQQVLFNFTFVTTCLLDLWKNVPREDEDVVFYPRLRYKRLVVQRAYWKLRPGVFPRRESGQSDADFLLAVTRWRKKHNLPTRVFVTRDMTQESSDISGRSRAQVRTYKPLYVDFENYFSLAVLEATMRDAMVGMIITEMLPGRDQLWLQQDGRSYVSEFVWENNGGDLDG